MAHIGTPFSPLSTSNLQAERNEQFVATLEAPITSSESTHAITLRLDGSDMLVRALTDHMATLDLSRQLAAERDALQAEVSALRNKYESTSSPQ